MGKHCFSSRRQRRGCYSTRRYCQPTYYYPQQCTSRAVSPLSEEAFQRLRFKKLQAALGQRTFRDVRSQITQELQDTQNAELSAIDLKVHASAEEIRGQLAKATFIDPIGKAPASRFQRVFTFSVPSGTKQIGFSTFHYGTECGGQYTGKLSTHFNTSSLRMKLGEQFELDHKRVGDRDVYTLALRHDYVGGMKLRINGKSYILYSHDNPSNYEAPKEPPKAPPKEAPKTSPDAKPARSQSEDSESSPSDRRPPISSPSDRGPDGKRKMPRPSKPEEPGVTPLNLDGTPTRESRSPMPPSRVPPQRQPEYSPPPVRRSPPKLEKPIVSGSDLPLPSFEHLRPPAPKEIPGPLRDPFAEPPRLSRAPLPEPKLEPLVRAPLPPRIEQPKFERTPARRPYLDTDPLVADIPRRQAAVPKVPELRIPDISSLPDNNVRPPMTLSGTSGRLTSLLPHREPAPIRLPAEPPMPKTSAPEPLVSGLTRRTPPQLPGQKQEFPEVQRQTPKLSPLTLRGDYTPSLPDLPLELPKPRLARSTGNDSLLRHGPAPLPIIKVAPGPYVAPAFERRAKPVFLEQDLDDLERLAKMCVTISNDLQPDSFLYDKGRDHDDLYAFSNDVVSSAYKNPYFAFSNIAGARFGLAKGRSVERLNEALCDIDRCYQGGDKDDYEARYSLYQRAGMVESFVKKHRELPKEKQYLSKDELQYLDEYAERLRGLSVYLRKVEPLVEKAIEEEDGKVEHKYREERQKSQRDGIEETLVDAVHRSIEKMFCEKSSFTERVKAASELAKALEMNPDGLTYEDAEYLEKTLVKAKETLASESFVALLKKEGDTRFTVPFMKDVGFNLPGGSLVEAQYGQVLKAFERFNKMIPQVVEVSSNREYIDESRINFYDALDSRKYEGPFVQDADGQYRSPREIALRKFAKEAFDRIDLERYRISNLPEEGPDHPLRLYHQLRLRQLAREEKAILKAAEYQNIKLSLPKK